MSGFCAGVNGKRETWSFVFVGGDWKGFSFEVFVYVRRGVYGREGDSLCEGVLVRWDEIL